MEIMTAFRGNSLRTSLLVSACLSFTVAWAAPGDLSQAPLFLSNQAKPNLLLAIDDSVSMDYELSMPTSDGALWWHTGDKNFVGRNESDSVEFGHINVNKNGTADSTWKRFSYLFPNGANSSYDGKRMLADASNGSFAVPPVDAYAYARSPDYNRGYYNPDVEYQPWPSNGSYSFTNASPAAAPYDPVYPAAGSLDLTVDFDATNANWGAGNWQFKFFAGMYDETNTPVAAESLRAVSYFPATYFRPAGTPDNTNYSANPGCSTCKAPDGSLMDRYIIKQANYSSPAAYQAAIQNFANWFTYYRRRHQAMRAGLAHSLDSTLDTRVGYFTTNTRETVVMRDLDSAGDKAGLFNLIYTSVGNYTDSPNRLALNHAGKELTRTGSSAPVQYQCQQNAALLATDGYSDTDVPMGMGSNYDHFFGIPYSDGYSGTLADIAMRYYFAGGHHLSGSVPVENGCGVSGHPPWLDCNTRIHMNTLALQAGGNGGIYGNTHIKTMDAYQNTPAWSSPSIATSQTQVDDLYHAVINARGDIFQYQQHSALAGKIRGSLHHLVAVEGSVAAAGFSTSALTANSAVYLSIFDSSSWSGDLKAWRINSDGSVGASQWSAAAILDNRRLSESPRSIVTFNATQSKGVAFKWDLLDSAMKDDLRTDSNGDIENSDTAAKERLSYLRGKRNCEWGSTSGCSVAANMRTRGSILGDIIHSSPVYVGKPGQQWPNVSPFPTGSTYQSFVDSMSGRMGMVYVGGNDGMLHGFRSRDGSEQFSYIPHAVVASGSSDSGLHYLTQANYSHRNYVDATPTVSDAYVGSEWKTVLVGALGSGGRGIYALDITNPEGMNDPDTADGKVMWEFTNDDLGYSFGQPVIAPMKGTSGIEWYVIVANGYNDPVGGTHDGEAQLFLLKLSGPGNDGVWDLNQDYYLVTTGAQSLGSDSRNGLSPVQVVDYSGNHIADRAYAGDLFGNLWGFDLSKGAGSAQAKKLFTTIDNQAITGKPAVAYHPDMPFTDDTKPNLMVLFGSGQYLTYADKSTTTGQYFYGLWDRQADLSTASTITLSQLVEQGPISSVSSNGGDYRILDSPNAVAYSDPVNPKSGWYLPLPDSGERVVTDPLVLGRVIYFATTTPVSTACDYGVTGWLMGLDLANGSRTAQSIFDINNDHRINYSDRVSGSTGETVASGQKQSGKLPQSPANMGNNVYTTDSNGDLQSERVGDASGADSDSLVRQSWRQLYYQRLQ